MTTKKEIIIGDNPFHGISHLSQERARARSGNDSTDNQRADLVFTAIENGADGFMFSVSETTLGILKAMRKKQDALGINLYAIVPYTFEYVRIATQTGTPGLATKFIKQIAGSGNLGAMFSGLKAVTRSEPSSLLETYLAYEISRIKSAVGDKTPLSSLFLHEVVTDMSLALDFKWIFDTYATYLKKHNVTPGFHTRNFPLLVNKLTSWGYDLNELMITTPFNKVGFQMNPGREECEATLSEMPHPNVLAISVMACGYFKPPQAVDYVAGLDNLKGVVAGVSNPQQARELFPLFSQRLT
ncbi:MAG: hypothetical protein NWF04_03915 [Candidatus Bathyarchaeota archaeon]|nr:hypothetical protein [Candidatus Bathyarchaeota archaeon]